jgi:hypothetical protein
MSKIERGQGLHAVGADVGWDAGRTTSCRVHAFLLQSTCANQSYLLLLLLLYAPRAGTRWIWSLTRMNCQLLRLRCWLAVRAWCKWTGS